MKKLTLGIKDKDLITWAKNYARSNNTSVSTLFESHIRALKEFEKIEVKIKPRSPKPHRSWQETNRERN